ncbi:hypothetical protein ILUMI_14348 [Ignelater luminosus]|uniref:DUF4371 domain-containing protein n=1 Tax=Ignelater luminosus TaxID=2038154 RepID=A0A8K0G4Y0_IGNLU|nr:hypothetical protein ILUMI_14348 [Ignelater luminosus]
MSKAPFLALIMDETSDISVKSQLSTVVRSDRTANGLLQHAFKVLGDLDHTGKFVAQTYDGAAVMAGEHGGLQAKLCQHCKSATFNHCYVHKLNLVLSQSASFVKQVKVLFTSLAGFSSFFGKSTKRSHALDQFVNRRLPHIAPTHRNFQRDGFDQFWRRMDKFVSECIPPTKRLCLDSVSREEKKVTYYGRVRYESLDIIILNIT